MAKRIYWNTAKKWGLGAGIPGGIVGFSLLFIYLSTIGVIDVTGYSGDSICEGTLDNPCLAFINFTANEDIFIYPLNYDPYDRLVPFQTDKGLESWKMYRSWGSGWREIDLHSTCKGTWCGGKYGTSTNVYSFAFREGRDYQIKIEAVKNSPYDTVKWSFTKFVDPFWYAVNASVDTTTQNVSYLELELGSQINITTNHTTYSEELCVDIDHPSYGDEYLCGLNNLTFLFNISNFRNSLFSNEQNTLSLNFTGNGTIGNSTTNETGIKIQGHQYDAVDLLNINIMGSNESKIGFPRNVTIYRINQTSNTTNIDRYYDGTFIGDALFLNHTSEGLYEKNLTDTIGGVPQTIFFNLDDNIGTDYTLVFNLTGYLYGASIFNTFDNNSIINITNNTAHITSGAVLSNNTDKLEMIYDDFEDGSFNSLQWLDPASDSNAPCNDCYHWDRTFSESSGYFELSTEIDFVYTNEAGRTITIPHVLDVNISRFNLHHVEDINFTIGYIKSSHELMPHPDGGPVGGNRANISNNVELGGTTIWQSEWTSCGSPDNVDCNDFGITPGNLNFTLNKQDNSTWHVQIAGKENIYGTRTQNGCGSYNHTYDWTTGTFQETFQSCSSINGDLVNDFYVNVNYSENPSLRFKSVTECEATVGIGSGSNGCESADNDYRIFNVNRTLYKRNNASLITETLYSTSGNIERIIVDYDLFAWSASTLDLNITPFVSNNGGETWEVLPFVEEPYFFVSSGGDLVFRADFMYNTSNHGGEYLNDSIRLDNLNITISDNFPSNVSIDWGDDGTDEVSLSGELNSSNSPVTISISGKDLTNAFGNASNLYGHTYQIPLTFLSDSLGTLGIDAINLTSKPNPIQINTSSLESYFISQTNYSNYTNFSIPIDSLSGTVNVSDLKYDYAGGSKNITIITYPSNLTINSFNNSLSTENLTFVQDVTENITRYIDIPLSSNLQNNYFYLNLTGNFSGSIGNEFQDAIAYYSLNETTGDAIDSVNGIYNASVLNGVVRGENGILNNSYNFDGVDDYLNLTTPTLSCMDDKNCSISLWVNLTQHSGQAYVWYQGNATLVSHVALLTDLFEPNNIGFQLRDDDANLQNIMTTIPIKNSHWNHIVAVLNTSSVLIYINGTLANQTAITVGDITSGNKQLELFGGRASEIEDPLNFTLDEIAIYNNSLSAEHILDIYNNGDGAGYDPGFDFVSFQYLEIGTPGNNHEWSFTGGFNQEQNQTKNLSIYISDSFNLGSCEGGVINDNNCSIPFQFSSNANGTLEYFWQNNISYGDRGMNNTLIINNFFSQWDYSFGSPFINFLEFIPLSPTQKNVTPFGQNDIYPILNITNLGYHLQPTNLSLLINDTNACINITISQTNSKLDGNLLNNSWLELNQTVYGENKGFWMWADYACENNQNFTLFYPEFFFRQVKNASIGWEGI